ncbi:MAG: HD domain-containing protein [Candidatus Omnitrophica bacterium]|nr:HD domain-containing protein [Candidatus Omnitrophota bacterium]
MVRLIKIIKNSFKRSREAAGPDSQVVSGASGMPQPSAPPAPIGSVRSAENPYRRKSSSQSSAPETQETVERISGLKDLYRDLQAAVECALTGIIARQKVEDVIAHVVHAFEKRPYNELLVMAYAFSKNNYLASHITNDVILSVGFAASLGYSRQEMIDLGVCAFTHDLGMSGFDGVVKKGQQLSDQEIEDIKQHPLRSAEIVRPVFSEKVAAVVLDVHERENGQGYPRGIPGAEIHLWAKIISVCDTFEALTHPRVFRTPYSPYEAMKIIIKKKDILFDDTIVKRFIDFISIYPVGSFVYLNSGETAMVVGSNAGFPTRPMVKILVNENRELEEGLRIIDLAKQDFVYISGAVEPERERDIDHFLKPRGLAVTDELA